jgi:uncharacterized repeat protein (TIGR03803 family)
MIYRKFSLPLRSLLLISLASLFLTPAKSQELWGMTTDGGAEGVGAIYSMTLGGAYTKHFDFPLIEGGSPKGEFFEAANGKIYGVTEFGGLNGEGILFEYEPNSSDIIVLHNFDPATGSRPIAGVIQATNGKLYGTCSAGGTNGLGALFEYDIVTSSFSAKVNFNGAGNGSAPQGTLTLNTSGLIYGTCWTGGSFGSGTLFSYAPGATAVSVLHTFSAPPFTLGGRPFGGVTQFGNTLLGTTQLGGSLSGGTIYEYNLTTNAYAVLVDLGGTDGANPLSGLVEVNGKFYGTASSGGDFNQGTLFEYDPNGSGFGKLTDFSSTVGTVPIGRITDGQNGKIYGITTNGGTNGKGTLYSFDLVGSSGLVVERQLDNVGLEAGWSGLVYLNTGVLIGMTKNGGSASSGAAFNFDPNTSILTVDISFGFSEARRPRGRLIEGSDGFLYGMTNSGGTSDEGVIFKFNPTNDAFTVLFNLGGADFGGFPEGALLERNGFLFGMCRTGGSSNGGTVFKYNLTNGNFTKLANLSSSTGTEPFGGFSLAQNGLLYGVCSAGGTSGNGTIIQVNPSNNAVTKVHDFDGTNGATPAGDLMEASNGILYGTTQDGGVNNEGTLFQYVIGGSVTKLFDFDFVTGSLPEGQLLEWNGKLYGTTSNGGPNFVGVIYSWDIVNAVYSGFSGQSLTTGHSSRSSLLEINGNLWATTASGAAGGGTGNGSIIRINPTNGIITKIKDFPNPLDGVRPTNGLLPIVAPSTASMNLKVFLEGPYDGSSLMDDDLRTLASFPLSEPYTALGFAQVGEGGGESISSTVLSTTGNNAIVDWIMVELRDKANSTSIVNTRIGLLQRDGDIVDLDGTSALEMSVPNDDYYIAIRHRNHHGVMTASTVSLSTTSTATVNFTLPGTATFGTNAQKNIGGSNALFTGNANPDNVLKYTGADNDRDKILVKIGGSVPTATFSGYAIEDVNMDGIVKYTGALNDRDLILVNIGGSVPTNTRVEQLP